MIITEMIIEMKFSNKNTPWGKDNICKPIEIEVKMTEGKLKIMKKHPHVKNNRRLLCLNILKLSEKDFLNLLSSDLPFSCPRAVMLGNVLIKIMNHIK